MASANETSDHCVSEVEHDKRAAESRSSHTEENEPLEQDDRRRDERLHGGDSNENLNRNRANNRRSFRGRGHGWRGHFKPHPRGGQQGRPADDVYPEEHGHPKSRGHYQGYQKTRGTKFLTVSATSSSRDVQIGNGDQLHIKVDLSQTSAPSSSAAPSGHHQQKQNNQHHQQRISTNENEGDNHKDARNQDYRYHGRNNRNSEVKFISTSEGNRQEFHHEHSRYDHRQHNHPSTRGFDHPRRNFRPPRWGGNGRWQRGFIPPRDSGEFRGNDEPFRGSRGFRPPRGGRVFRRRGQGRDRGSSRQVDESSNHTTNKEVFPHENLEPQCKEREDFGESNAESYKVGAGFEEGGGGGEYPKDEAFHNTTDYAEQADENAGVHEESHDGQEEVPTDSTLVTCRDQTRQSDEILNKLAGSLENVVTIAEEIKETKTTKENSPSDNVASIVDDEKTSSKNIVPTEKEDDKSGEDKTISGSHPSPDGSKDTIDSLDKEAVKDKVKGDDEISSDKK